MEQSRNHMGLISPKQFYEKVNATLDCPMGKNTIYRLVKRRNFPSVKIGGRYFIMEDKVEEWLMNQTRNRV